jgi:hypothetical protein
MLTRTQLGIVVGACLLMVGSAAWALQAGGVEVGDLETGSVVGQPFKELGNSRAGILRSRFSILKSVRADRSS